MVSRGDSDSDGQLQCCFKSNRSMKIPNRAHCEHRCLCVRATNRPLDRVRTQRTKILYLLPARRSYAALGFHSTRHQAFAILLPSNPNGAHPFYDVWMKMGEGGWSQPRNEYSCNIRVGCIRQNLADGANPIFSVPHPSVSVSFPCPALELHRLHCRRRVVPLLVLSPPASSASSAVVPGAAPPSTSLHRRRPPPCPDALCSYSSCWGASAGASGAPARGHGAGRASAREHGGPGRRRSARARRAARAAADRGGGGPRRAP